MPIMATLFSTVLLSAQNATPPSGSKDIRVVLKTPNKNTANRPKSPSRQSIDCYYSGESLSVSFLYPEGECTMTITDNKTGLSLQYNFSTEEPAEIYTGNLSEAYLEFNTELGNSYEGWINE